MNAAMTRIDFNHISQSYF